MFGRYTSQCGGVDAISKGIDGKNTADLAFEAIREAIKIAKAEGYNVLAEGMLFGAYATHRFESLMKDIEDAGDEAITIFFTATVDECYKRVMIRNGNKPVNIKNIEDKYKTVRKRIDQWKERGYTSYQFGNTGSLEELVARFDRMMEA